MTRPTKVRRDAATARAPRVTATLVRRTYVLLTVITLLGLGLSAWLARTDAPTARGGPAAHAAVPQ